MDSFFSGYSITRWKTMNYLSTAAEMEEFFLRVMDLKEDTRENRIKILEDMVRERKAFHQTDEQIIKRIKGKKVLHVKAKRKE